MERSRFLKILTGVTVGSTVLSGCQKDKKTTSKLVRIEQQRPLMGTLFRIVTYATDLPKARDEIERAFEFAEDLATVGSDYDPESELNRFCQAPAGEPVLLSPLLFEVLQHALEMAKKTEGAYDPTLGPLTHLWRETRRRRKLPINEELESARARCGYRHLRLNAEEGSGTLALPEMQLDLGGIAKGYAADLMLESLTQAGFARSLIAAGGDLRLGEAPPEEAGWKVALQEEMSQTHILSKCAVSTSGSLYQKVTIEGRDYSHLIDPRTGLGSPILKSLSVRAPEAKFADPLATAAAVHAAPEDLLARFPECDLI